MRGSLSALTVATVLTIGLANATEAQLREGRTSIEWPGERAQFPTLQSAIDAVADSGTVFVGEGQFNERVIIRNKRVTLEGKGCGEQLPHGKSKTDRATVLLGPRPDRVLPFRDAVPLVTYIADSGAVTGGVIKRVKLSGLDVGVGVLPGSGSEPGRAAVTIEDVCIADSARGISVSASSAKVVAQNVLIRNVLWNGIAISPIAADLANAMFISFGVAVANTGQACVVVKNSLYTAFQNHFEECGFNLGSGLLPGAGGGVLAQNAGVNFLESSINASNGPGIAATGGTTFIQSQSEIVAAHGMGILLFEPLAALIKDTQVRLTQPFPPGHPKAGNFGDAVLAVGGGSVWIGDSLLANTARAGIANWGSFVDVGNTKIQCSVFDLEGEPLGPQNFAYNDRGGNLCGCPTANGTCEAVSAGLAPPDAVGGSE